MSPNLGLVSPYTYLSSKYILKFKFKLKLKLKLKLNFKLKWQTQLQTQTYHVIVEFAPMTITQWVYENDVMSAVIIARMNLQKNIKIYMVFSPKKMSKYIFLCINYLPKLHGEHIEFLSSVDFALLVHQHPLLRHL